jgi:hypothetical protein
VTVELVDADPVRRHLALVAMGLADGPPPPVAVASRPQPRYQLGINRDLDHPAMAAWRERSGVSRADHQRMRSLARGGIELTRSSGGQAALALVEGGPDRGGVGSTLQGHFAVFNAWTEIDSLAEGLFLERIAPGAFAKAFREKGRGIKVLLEHGHDPVVGNKPLGRRPGWSRTTAAPPTRCRCWTPATPGTCCRRCARVCMARRSGSRCPRVATSG